MNSELKLQLKSPLQLSPRLQLAFTFFLFNLNTFQSSKHNNAHHLTSRACFKLLFINKFKGGDWSKAVVQNRLLPLIKAAPSHKALAGNSMAARLFFNTLSIKPRLPTFL